MTDWYPPDTTPMPTLVRPKPHRHRWVTRQTDDGPVECCDACFRTRDAERTRRGKSSKRAGGDAERLVEKLTGLTKVGEYGGKVDVGDAASWAVGQVKAGHRYSTTDEHDLDAMIPEAHGRPRLLFKVKRPGPGHPRRVTVTLRLSDLMAEHGDCLVTVDMPDWQDLHGPVVPHG